MGLISMTFLLIYPILFGFRTYRRMKGRSQQLCLVLLLNLMAFLFQMTNVAILGWGQQSVLLWIFMAMTMIHPSIHASEADLRVRAEDISGWHSRDYEEWPDSALAPSTTN